MVRRGPFCDPNRLRLLLHDNLPTEQQAEVVEHLDGCAQCQETLEGLAADRNWWNRLRQLPRSGMLARPQPESTVSELGADFPADFLTPTADPAHLGQL